MYMGPGIWFDLKTKLLRIRLSHTRHNFPRWPAYTGITDPRQLRLANCENLEFDHVNIRGGTNAIRFEVDGDLHNDRIVFHDCEIDGGMPTWFFRSDRKDGYSFVPATIQNATEADVRPNPLGSATSNALLSSRRNANGTEVHHCELVNAHDICLFGQGMRFHHNWVNNINDDALFMGSTDAATDDLWIYRNVVTKVLTTLSFASKTPLGQVRIFRNLFDIREPILGIRPRSEDDINPLRQGLLYKSNGPEGPIDLWHNTCLVLNAGSSTIDHPAVGYTVFKTNPPNAGQRRSYNNIFVAAYPDSGITRAIAYLPLASFDGPTDGNLYERIGPEDTDGEDRFLVTAGDPNHFATLKDYNIANEPWEDNGILANPLFRSFNNDTGFPDPENDDLRPRHKSGANRAAQPRATPSQCPPTSPPGIRRPVTSPSSSATTSAATGLSWSQASRPSASCRSTACSSGSADARSSRADEPDPVLGMRGRALLSRSHSSWTSTDMNLETCANVRRCAGRINIASSAAPETIVAGRAARRVSSATHSGDQPGQLERRPNCLRDVRAGEAPLGVG
jgi:hypothetical protein